MLIAIPRQGHVLALKFRQESGRTTVAEVEMATDLAAWVELGLRVQSISELAKEAGDRLVGELPLRSFELLWLSDAAPPAVGFRVDIDGVMEVSATPGAPPELIDAWAADTPTAFRTRDLPEDARERVEAERVKATWVALVPTWSPGEFASPGGAMVLYLNIDERTKPRLDDAALTAVRRVVGGAQWRLVGGVGTPAGIAAPRTVPGERWWLDAPTLATVRSRLVRGREASTRVWLQVDAGGPLSAALDVLANGRELAWMPEGPLDWALVESVGEDRLVVWDVRGELAGWARSGVEDNRHLSSKSTMVIVADLPAVDLIEDEHQARAFAVWQVRVPPLRSRRRDIRWLVLARWAQRPEVAVRGTPTLSEASWRRLARAQWRDNEFELMRSADRLAIAGEYAEVELAATLGDRTVRETPDDIVPFTTSVREILERALDACDGRIYGKDGAASRLGMAPSTLQSKLAKLHIDRRRFVR